MNGCEGPEYERVNALNAKFYRLAKFSGMPLATGDTQTLITFIPSKGTEEAYNAALAFVAVENGTPIREHHFLTFIGEPGRGKTHLAMGIGWHWIGHGIGTVKYWHVSELLDAIRAEYDHPPLTRGGFPMIGAFELAKGCGLLILDDLGVEKSTGWAIDKLDTLVNHRWLEELPTIFTTNMTAMQLQPRLRSRIKEGVTVTLDGIDYRAYKAKIRQGL